MKRYLILAACLLLPLSVQAAALNLDFQSAGGQLRLANAPRVDQAADVGIGRFNQLSAASQGAYRLYISDMYDKPLVNYRFDLLGDSLNLQVPYFETVKHLAVSKVSDGSLLIDQDLRSLATCFPNGICEYEKGETEVSCMVDCSLNAPRYSSATLKQLEAAGGIIKDSRGVRLVELRGNPSSPWVWPLAGLGLIIIIAVIFWYAKKRLSRR